MSNETIFRVSFVSQGEVYEIYARNVSQGGLFGFIEIEELVFGERSKSTDALYGAVLGGMIVGLSENLSVMIIPTTYKPAVPFLLILAILYVRPDGIFGGKR